MMSTLPRPRLDAQSVACHWFWRNTLRAATAPPPCGA